MLPTSSQTGNAARPQARPDQPLSRAHALPASPTADRPNCRHRIPAARTFTSASQDHPVRPRPPQAPELHRHQEVHTHPPNPDLRSPTKC